MPSVFRAIQELSLSQQNEVSYFYTIIKYDNMIVIYHDI